jgi:Putative Ig domain
MPFDLLQAPATAILDQNYNLTLSWNPVATPLSVPPYPFSSYNHWDITTTVNAGPNQIARFSAPVGYAGGTLTYTSILSAGVVTLTMQGFSSTDDSVPLTDKWDTSGINTARPFPTALVPASTVFSSTSLLLGQTLTVTLSSSYTGANQWQVNWPDGTSTGWLPLASNVVTKSFSTPGAMNVVIQTRYNYTAVQYAPPTTLISQITQQIFVVDQQAPSTSSVQSGLTGDLGIGGQQGFEIVNATSGTVSPEPWEVIARAVVRDPVTGELKLLIATSRFSNASSLFGTMALDVFPMQGRPRGLELIVPPYELTVTSATETVPVSITTTALPTLYVGKSVTQALGGTFALQAANGITPYIWSSVGLPEGLTINASGILNGTPLELGQFEVTLAVQDSSVPFSIAEVTLLLTVATDLLVIIAPNQVDAQDTPLTQTGTTLGEAQVGTPYNVLVQVGNIDPNATIPGGLPPYTWSAPAGAFPTGLTIVTDPANSLYGLISGVPTTYNSTTDFATTYSVTVQVTDSIGAKATQTYTMSLLPEGLGFGHLNQLTLYPDQNWKLVVPVFGGQSPYVLNSFEVPPADTGVYGTAVLVDGQVEIPVIGLVSTGTHTFSLQVTDSASHTTGLVQFSYIVETEISDVRLISGYLVNWAHPLDGSWGFDDTSSAGQTVNVPLNVAGNLSGFALLGTRLNLTAVGNAVGAPLTTTYTMASNANFAAFVGQVFYVSGFSNAANNGTFTCSASTVTTLTLNNQLGVAQAAPTYTLTLTAAAATSGGATVYTYDATTYGNGADNALAGLTFTVAGFTNAPNNGPFVCSASTSTTVTLVNNAGVAEVHAATAVTPLAKALTSAQAPNGATVQVLSNDITMAVDPTYLTVGTTFSAGAPDVEWMGPPGPNPSTNAGLSAIFRNTEVRVPLSLQQNFNLTSVAAGTGVYSGTITGGAANAYAGQLFTITGFTNPANNNAVTPFDSSVAVTPFMCTASTSTSLTLNNPSSVAESNTSALATTAAANSYEQVSRIYETLSHSDPAPQILTSVASSVGGTAVYTGTIVGGASNAFAGFSFTVSGFTNGGNNGYFACTASSATTLTLVNANAVVETHAAQANGDIGNITAYTRAYIVGDVIGLNPRKPYYNSPDVPSFNGISAWTAIVQGGSSLPLGLSLDANTGLIYGTLAGTTNLPSVIEYIDITGAIHGTVTINWVTFLSQFVLTDQVIDSQQVGLVYNGATAFVAPPGVTLVSANLAYGVLPQGLSVTTDGTNIVIQGTPTEAGYFDCWFVAQSSNNQSAYVYHRISTIIPVEVLSFAGWADITSTSPTYTIGPIMPFPIPNAIVSANYVDPVTGNPVALIAQYGDPPRTFVSSTPTLPYHGVTLAGTQAINGGQYTAFILGGSGITAFSPNPTTFTFNIIDSASNTASVTFQFASQTSALSITSVPVAPFSVTAGVTYAPLVTFTGHGSVLTPFNFVISPISANSLPVGLTLTNATATTATIQGTTTQTGYGTKVVTIRLSDTSGAYVDVPYTFTVGTSIDIQTGIDYQDGTSIGVLGYVDAGNVTSITARPNLSFYVVETNAVATSTAGITVTTNNANITGTVKTLSGGVAQIELTGSGFNVGVGTYSVAVTVVDSGVSKTKTFTWTVYNDGTMTLAASNAIPTRLTTPT